MKLCFYHQPFDVDVSSGTEHAMSQWSELCMAMGVTEVAVIDETDDNVHLFPDEITVTEYSSLEQFEEMNENLIYVEHGGKHYKEYDYNDDSWLVIGGSKGLPKADVQIPTKVALYPREAAAIVLSEVKYGNR